MTVLQPVMGVAPAPSWTGARWIGTLDVADILRLSGRVELRGTENYSVARFLIRDGLAVRGFVEVPVTAGAVSADEVRSANNNLSEPVGVTDFEMPAVTVAVTTRNRPDNIAPLITSLLRIDYPEFEVVIVDNASDSLDTLRAVEQISDSRVRAIREPLPGASRGRNAAILAARYDIVAFIDDDVVVDPLWLRGVAQGFARADDVGVVTGMVPTGELLSDAQGYFEQRIGWEVACRTRVFSLARPPSDIPLFPFEVGVYGTGANFAIRRSVALEIGGLSEALGTGSPAGGGEDIDLFVRVLYAGYSLAYEPTSVVWHRHRRSGDELERQMTFYGRGFGAWITSVLLDPAMRPDALRLALGGLRRARGVAQTDGFVHEPERRGCNVNGALLRRAELIGIASGPFWYARSRGQRRLTRPLARR